MGATDGLWGADGIIGVGSPAAARVRGKTFLQSLASCGGYKHFAIGISLDSSDDTKNNFFSIAELAELENNHGGECVAVPFYDYREYSMLADLALVVNNIMWGPADPRPVVVLDSGATSIKIPGDVYDDFMGALIPDYEQACRLAGTRKTATACNCTTHMEVGDIVWTFKGPNGKLIDITLKPEDFMVKHKLPIPGQDESVCLFWGVMPGPANMPWWLLGTNVMRHTDVIFGAYGDNAIICRKSSTKRVGRTVEHARRRNNERNALELLEHIALGHMSARFAALLLVVAVCVVGT